MQVTLTKRLCELLELERDEELGIYMLDEKQIMGMEELDALEQELKSADVKDSVLISRKISQTHQEIETMIDFSRKNRRIPIYSRRDIGEEFIDDVNDITYRLDIGSHHYIVFLILYIHR